MLEHPEAIHIKVYGVGQLIGRKEGGGKSKYTNDDDISLLSGVVGRIPMYMRDFSAFSFLYARLYTLTALHIWVSERVVRATTW